jgi:hypothetical protein
MKCGGTQCDEATALNDADTADLFTEISRGVDKSLWMVEAHTSRLRRINRRRTTGSPGAPTWNSRAFIT